jgi:aryl-alcohol dehydrogenase-like predicted oxidoreductase
VAERGGWTEFVSMQNRVNLLYREEELEMIPQCIDQGVAILPYSPLAQGYLAGTQARTGERLTTRARERSDEGGIYGRPADFDVIDHVREIADAHGVPPAQVALAWLLHKPGITAPIIGATKAKHIDDAAAATRLALSPHEIEELELAYVPRPAVN